MPIGNDKSLPVDAAAKSDVRNASSSRDNKVAII